MSTIVRMRERHSHPATTARKVGEVEQIAGFYQDLRRDIAHRYWAHEHLPVVIHNPKSVVTLRRGNGEAAANRLGSHLQGNAVLDGLDVVRGSWEQTFAKVRSRAARKFSDAERHEVNWLLRWPEHLVTILDGGTVVPEIEKFASNDHTRIDHWLGEALKKHRPGQPTLKRKVTFEIDDYRVSVRTGQFSVWLTTQGLIKGKPIRIPMSGSDLEFLDGTANLRVSVINDVKGQKRIVFRKAHKIEVIERTSKGAVGIDKGANIAIVATDSDAERARFFGAESGEILGRRSDRSFRKGRSKMASRADNLAGRYAPSGRFHGNPNPSAADRRAARHIRKNNLGSKRRDAEQRRSEAELKNLCGRSAREMVEAFPDTATFHEEKLDFTGADQRRPKKTKRKINRWTKKELSQAIDRHVSAAGGRREFVNAAYTSQARPRCSWTNRGNRKDIAFRCSHCGYLGHADAVASSNVRARGSDLTITRYTPFKAVKQILLHRHATTDARCASRGCGSSLSAVGSAESSQLAA